MPERFVPFDFQFGKSWNVHTRQWRSGRHAYDVRGNLWAALAGLGGIIQINPRGVILGFIPIPNDDAATTNFAFGGPDNQLIYLEGATSGTFWRFKAPFPGLIGPGGVRLPAQP